MHNNETQHATDGHGFITLERGNFHWVKNPLLLLARGAIISELNGITAKRVEHDPPLVNELDVVLQSMLSLPYYGEDMVWGADLADDKIKTALQKPYELNAARAITEFSNRMVIESRLPNKKLITDIVSNQYERVVGREGNIRLQDKEDVLLELREGQDIFGAEAVLTKKYREYIHAKPADIMIVRERNSAIPILMKSVDSETSKFYAENFHYLHKAREDEVIAFGAYLERSRYPFAWVSYSPIGSKVEQKMAELTGVDPSYALEMTRAWNINWSPKNTMSLLFAYAHKIIQNNYRDNGRQGGILTAINPNLGFTGMAFSGVDFSTVGLKPTNHKYYVDDDGHPVYMLRRDIAARLGVAEEDLPYNDRYAESKMPLLPTNIMMVLFDGKGNSRSKPDTPIYVTK